jgi:hypothetical protein
MSCDRLFRAQNPSAYFSTTHKTLVVTAEVTLNPTRDSVHICRNLLQGAVHPGGPEFVLSGHTRPGIHADLVVTRTVMGVFPMDATPASVVLYSQGVDSPARAELKVGDRPPVPAPAPQPAGAPPSATPSDLAGSAAGKEATGWSASYSYDEAVGDAVAQLKALVGVVNPDVGIRATVVETGVQICDFTLQTGLFVKLRAS